MLLFLKHADVQQAACNALISLAVLVHNQSIIAKAWGIDAIVAAMMEHPLDCELQQAGCKAILLLSQNADNSVFVAKCW